MRKLQWMGVLAVLLCVICSLCAAEDVREVSLSEFKVSAVVPKGYSYVDQFASDILYLGVLEPEDKNRPVGMITIAYDEIAGGKSLDELSEEQISAMVAEFLKDTPAARVSRTKTEKGTGILILDTETANECCYDIVTLWKGYQIAVRMLPGQNQNRLTQEQKDLVISFLSNITIEKR